MAETLLTPSQTDLAIHLFHTETTQKAKIVRRRDLGNAHYELYEFPRQARHFEFREHPEEFALTAHREHIEQPLSELYINLRNMSSETLGMVGVGIAETIPEDIKPDTFVVGIPDAGTAIGHAVAEAAKMNELNLILKAPADSAVRFLPNPDVMRGSGLRVLLVDDLITQAATKIDAASVVEQMGFIVAGVAVLVDREQGGREELEQRGYKLYAAMKLSSMLNLYLAEGLINQEKYDKVNDYLAPFRK